MNPQQNITKTTKHPIILSTLLTILLCCLPLITQATTAPQTNILNTWSQDLGLTENAKLTFRFEVTFMKIDVADVEALLADTDAATIAQLLIKDEDEDDLKDQATTTLLNTNSIAFCLTFLRDGGIERFVGGTGKNMEAAMEDNIITEPEYDLVWTTFQQTMSVLDERGAFEGDRLLYRVDGETVHLSFLGVDGDVLVDQTFTKPGWSRAIKGMFFADDSKFRKKFLKAIWQD